ncbi:MAG: hypothetical protein SH807_07595 [Blastochloris sp.]|nr:hypothetical protein [Blastochloris sp.]
MILFLKSEREFEWKAVPLYWKLPVAVLGFVTFGLVSRYFYEHSWEKQADISI